MILGDSLLVMASLAEREGLRGKVQCIYMDPPVWDPIQFELAAINEKPQGVMTEIRKCHPANLR